MLKRELTRIAHRAVWSWHGWRDCWRNEHSIRQWLVVFAISSGLALALPLGTGERALIVALGVLVLAAELMNTAVERTVDFISTERHDMAKRAKDAASAAVTLTALAGAAAWAVVLWGLAGW